jgi:uncharacterized protein (DUF1800 family)
MNNNIYTNLKLAGIVLLATLLASCGVETKTTSDIPPPTATQAARILTQATFGPTVEEINRLQTIGAGAWFNDQFSKPQTKHFDYVNQALSQLPANTNIDDATFIQSFWKQAINADDQLRQRVTFALSQIFVISFQNDNLANRPRGIASYYDMLGSHAFGNFRDLLEGVTKHPMMGIYLSSLRNQGSNGTAREPDENYAREIMQLFTIGLRMLKPDGSDTTTPFTPTYTNDDIKGLAKVFTGWSWGGPDKSANRFNSSITDTNPAYVDPNRDHIPMQLYPDFHESLPKICPTLGINISANVTGDESMKIALDTLFKHPNVGPFIGRQLIQRLVTSNPSPGYISRVSAAFEEIPGVRPRGDMKAVIQAVITDPEALDPTTDRPDLVPAYTYNSDNAGKIREPVIRLANWIRAFHIVSKSGKYLVGRTDNTSTSLGQTPMRSPTVFNFYRPDYQPPKTAVTNANLVAPEMQITDELTTFGYLNYMRSVIPRTSSTNSDFYADYLPELALAATPDLDLLLDRISLLLLQNNMSPDLRTKIKASMTATSNLNYRVYQAVFLTMVSPEYITQK